MDQMKITVLEDGTIKTETDAVSPVNHQSAEAFMADLARMTGGEVTRTRKRHGHKHTHTHVEQKS